MAKINSEPAEQSNEKPELPNDEVVVEKSSPTEISETNVEAETAVDTSVEATPQVTQVIVVDAPVAPKAKGNRVGGVLYSLLATVIYAILFAAAYVATELIFGGTLNLAFATRLDFIFPIPLFFIGMVLVVLVVNKAGWWSHIFGSVIVGLVVLFGTASLVLVSAGMLSMTQQQANLVFYSSLLQPTTIVAALLAREVAIWTGSVIARRGRKVKARNAEAHEKFEREQAELIPTD
jgi:hypothetical protein